MAGKRFFHCILLISMFLSLQCAEAPKTQDKSTSAPSTDFNLDDYEIIFDDPAEKTPPQPAPKPLIPDLPAAPTPDEPSQPQPAPPTAEKPDGFLLAFKYPRGSYILQQNQALNIDITLTIRQQSQSQNINMEFGQWMGLDVFQPADSITPAMQARFNRVKIHAQMPREEKNLDTDQPSTLSDGDEGSLLISLLDKTTVIPLDSAARIADIAPLDQIWTQLSDDYPDKAQSVEELKVLLGSGTICQLASQDTHFPREYIDVSDNWKVDSRVQISLLGEVSFDTVYTLSEVRQTDYGRIAVVDFSGTVNKDISSLQAGMQLPGGQSELHIPFTGRMRIWLDMGMLLDQTIDYQYEINQTSPDPEMPMEVNVKLSGRQFISLSAAR